MESVLSTHPHTVNANSELTATWEQHSPAILCRDLQHLSELLDPNGSKHSAGARRAHLLLQLTPLLGILELTGAFDPSMIV